MTLQEVKKSIQEAIRKRDLIHEFSQENYVLLSKHFGTFEAILTGRGEEKCLIPETGTAHFLYRGQNAEYGMCVPSIYRNDPDDISIFENRMRLIAFHRLLYSHPVVKHFFLRHNFLVNEEGLAQHYGLQTEILDLTSSLDVALFFALCKYDPSTDSYDYFRDGTHTGVLYVFDPILDNEPTPAIHLNYMNGNIRPIGLQAFPRPGVQYGYGLRIGKGLSTKLWIFTFEFTAEESKEYHDKFCNGNALWIKDRLADKTKEIAGQSMFSYSVFNETFAKFRPKGWSGSGLKRALSSVSLTSRLPDILFSAREQREIVEEWNDHLGRETASKIVRKHWFKHQSTEKGKNGEEYIRGIYNQMDFRTLPRINEHILLNLIASPNGPEGAEWRNYTGLPRPVERPHPDDGGWKKVEGGLHAVYGKPYMTEKDWIIEL